jgi:hypothetical protein
LFSFGGFLATWGWFSEEFGGLEGFEGILESADGFVGLRDEALQGFGGGVCITDGLVEGKDLIVDGSWEVGSGECVPGAVEEVVYVLMLRWDFDWGCW